MFTDSNVIVVMWLIPVVLQIALPLAILVGWSAMELVKIGVFRQFQTVGKGIGSLRTIPSA